MYRGILCEVFKTKKTDFSIPFLNITPEFVIFEMYFMNVSFFISHLEKEIEEYKVLKMIFI